jgi:hypothetical protein
MKAAVTSLLRNHFVSDPSDPSEEPARLSTHDSPLRALAPVTRALRAPP